MSESTYSIRNYRDTFTDRISEVRKGRVHVITNHGVPCARVVPIQPSRDVSGAIASIRNSQVKGQTNIKASIEEGRL